MNSDDSIVPPELQKILKFEKGYSLLIKGESGAGKSTLAVELLNRAEKGTKLLLSTRITPEQFFDFFPWISTNSKETIEIKDATQTGISLNNPLNMKGSVAIKLTGIPDLLRVVIDQAVQNENKKSFVVIDSWDALQLLFEHKQAVNLKINPNLNESSNFMYNAFMGLVRNYKINLILVAENISSMEYLVDGIIELRREILPDINKTLRLIEIKKSRGIRISNPIYPFTLENGRFHCFIPWTIDALKFVRNSTNIIELNKDEKDLLIETLRSSKHPVASIIFDPVHPEVLNILIENFAFYQLYYDELFTILPPEHFNIATFKKNVVQYLKQEKIDEERYYKNIRFFSFYDDISEDVSNDENIINVHKIMEDMSIPKDISSIVKILNGELEKFKKQSGNKRAVNFSCLLALKAIVNLQQEKKDKIFNSLITSIFAQRDSIFILSTTKEDAELTSNLVKTSTVFLELKTLYGCPFINFVTPQVQHLYGVMLRKQNDKLNFIDLLPVV
ncbi:MAG: RAD55 family ATPase [Promethearchaeota archaeon]